MRISTAYTEKKQQTKESSFLFCQYLHSVPCIKYIACVEHLTLCFITFHPPLFYFIYKWESLVPASYYRVESMSAACGRGKHVVLPGWCPAHIGRESITGDVGFLRWSFLDCCDRGDLKAVCIFSRWAEWIVSPEKTTRCAYEIWSDIIEVSGFLSLPELPASIMIHYEMIAWM